MKLVFVYGTLKTDLPNHYLMKDANNGIAKFHSKGESAQKYPLVVTTPFNIPFLLNKPNFGEFIEGEIYEVDEKMLAVLDQLERNGELYDRIPLTIKPLTGSNQSLSCDSYVINNFKETLLELPLLKSFTDSSKYVSPREVKRTLDEVLNIVKKSN